MKTVSRFRSPLSPSSALLGAGSLLTLAALTFGQPLAGSDHGGPPARVESSATPTLDRLSDEFQDVARLVEPSVVHIEVHKRPSPGQVVEGLPEGGFPPGFPDELRRFFEIPQHRNGGSGSDEGEEFRQFDVPPIVGTGSGWVYDSSGTIVTNNHVVDGAELIVVKLFDGSEHEAKVVATDASTDIAVLQIDADGLHAATLSMAPLRQGDIVFAFGSPLQFEFSMSQGIVAGMGRHTGILGPSGYEDFIQTDASINPGNSGGPLTNIHGEVVGMNAAIVSRSGLFSGMGFAIPAPMIRPVVQQLLASGKVSRGYLGVLIQDDPLLLQSFGFEGKGVVVSNVLPDGPGADAGLRAGDIVTAIDDQTVESSTELRQTIASERPGHRADLRLVRDGRSIDVEVTLGEIPGGEAGQVSSGHRALHEQGPAQVLAMVGIERATTLTPAISERLGQDAVEGVLVEAVRATSRAAEAGLRPGDVVLEVMGRPVTSTEELAGELHRMKPEQVVRLTVRTEGSNHYLVLRFPADHGDEGGE